MLLYSIITCIDLFSHARACTYAYLFLPLMIPYGANCWRWLRLMVCSWDMWTFWGSAYVDFSCFYIFLFVFLIVSRRLLISWLVIPVTDGLCTRSGFTGLLSGVVFLFVFDACKLKSVLSTYIMRLVNLGSRLLLTSVKELGGIEYSVSDGLLAQK